MKGLSAKKVKKGNCFISDEMGNVIFKTKYFAIITLNN